MLKTFSNKGEANAIPLNAENLNFNFTELINILHPIGEYFYTSDANFNPNTAWCGTWTLENDGTVLVSKSNESDSALHIHHQALIIIKLQAYLGVMLVENKKFYFIMVLVQKKLVEINHIITFSRVKFVLDGIEQHRAMKSRLYGFKNI